MIDLNLPASPGSPATPTSEGGGSNAPAPAETAAGRATPAAGGPLSALADLSETRRGVTRRTVSAQCSASLSDDEAERPAKRVRPTLSDSRAARVGDGAQANAAPWRNESAMHVFRWSMIRRQPMARLLRSGPVAHIANHLQPSSQRRLFDALLCTPQERYGYLRLMTPESAGRYLLRGHDRDVVSHALARGGEPPPDVPRPDLVVDRSGWLLKAGTSSAAKLDARITQRARNILTSAETQLVEQFDHAGPSTRTGAVRNLIATSSYAGTLQDAFRFAQTALAPQRFRALPLGERADALGALAEGISDAAYMSWQQLNDLSDGEEHEDFEEHLTTGLLNGLAETVPMLLNEARRLSPIPSDAARRLVTSLISALECSTPDIDTRRAILDLFDTQLPYLTGADRDTTLSRLAESVALFSQPQEQRRMLDMVLQRTADMPRPDDWLAHVGTEGRWCVPMGILNSLREVEDPTVCDEMLRLLANQLAPSRLGAMPGERLQAVLERALELDVPADTAHPLLPIIFGALDAVPGELLARPLRAMGRRATVPLAEALAQQLHHIRLRLLPRLPIAERVDMLAATSADVLDAMPPADQARLLAALTNDADDAAPRTRASVLAFVTSRLAARATAAPHALDELAHALPRTEATAWAGQLETELNGELSLRLTVGPRSPGPAGGVDVAHEPMQATLDALRRRLG
jgi:hypothetical protein